jgi:glycosyltransferase involved in cell wall biosynthesis
MKFLLYSHYFAPSIGGVETIVQSLADGLSKRRTASGETEFEVTLATSTAAGAFDDSLLTFQVSRQPTLLELWRQIRRCDIIHVAGPALLPLFLARLAGKPTVIEHHGYQAICLNGLLLYRPTETTCPGHFQAGHYKECLACQRRESGRVRTVLRLLLMFPRFWFSHKACTNLAITKHVLARHALPRSSVVYYGIEDPLRKGFSADSVIQHPKRICFAYLGRLVAEKGVPVLLEAVRMLKGQGETFEVQLIGDGPERSKLEAIIRRDGLEGFVRFTGQLTGSALADVLDAVHAVVMPSVWEETAGLAAIEQMVRGRLVIASDIGGLSEIVGNAGLKFPAGSASDLANCMRCVLKDRSLIDGIGRKARERALHYFARSRMIDEHASVYHELIRQRTTPV